MVKPLHLRRRGLVLDGLAEVLVGGGVVGLTDVAEAAGDGAEGGDELELVLRGGLHEGGPTVGLDAEDLVELRTVLGGDVLGDLDAGGMQDAVDAAPLFAGPGDGVVDGVPCW